MESDRYRLIFGSGENAADSDSKANGEADLENDREDALEDDDLPPRDSPPQLGEDDGRVALVVRGVVQSVLIAPARSSGGSENGARTGYWPYMLPDLRPRRSLILGLGGGTVPGLLMERFGSLDIVGIEHDQRVIDLARKSLGLAGLESNGLKVVVADAFEYVSGLVGSIDVERPAGRKVRAVASRPGRAAERFDYICLDLYDGIELIRQSLGSTFLRSLAALLGSSGMLVVNLTLNRRLPRQLNRLAKHFTISKTHDVDFNLVVFCKPR